jgi:ABC-2 type transport system ATP-binding protein
VASADGALRFTADEPAVADLSVALVQAGAGILELTPEMATLEQLFFRLTEGDEPAENGAPALPEPAQAAAS